MKSPQDIAIHLARQWQRSDWREAHLLLGQGVWPLQLPIGAPSAQSFFSGGPAVREHLQQWRAIGQSGPGSVQWEPRSYRGSAAPVDVPLHWTLPRPSDAIAAISRFAMKIDEQWQEAEMVERKTAQRVYEDFLHRKQDRARRCPESGFGGVQWPALLSPMVVS